MRQLSGPTVGGCVGVTVLLSFKLTQRVQSIYMVRSMVSVVEISLMAWVRIPHMGT